MMVGAWGLVYAFPHTCTLLKRPQARLCAYMRSVAFPDYGRMLPLGIMQRVIALLTNVRVQSLDETRHRSGPKPPAENDRKVRLS
jgi:hypothetical protein